MKTSVLTALAPSGWGTRYLATSELLPPERPLTAAALRALPAGLMLLAAARRLPTGRWWWRSAVPGALNIGVFLALLFVVAYRLPGGAAATIISMQPLLVAFLASKLLGERLTARAVVLALLGVAGVALLVLRAGARLDAIGVATALGAAVTMATGVVMSKRWSSKDPVLAMTSWQLLAGGLLVLPVALLVEGAPPTLGLDNVAGYGYLAIIGGAATYALWFRGIRALPSTQVTFLALLSPVVATTLGWIVLGQRLTPMQALGALIVLGSVLSTQASARARARAAGANAGGRCPCRAHTRAAGGGSTRRRKRSPFRTHA